MPKAKEQLKNKDLSDSWSKGGDCPDDYTVGISEKTFHSGSKCGFIKSAVEDPRGQCCLEQTFQAGGYAGQRVRLSAWLKAENVVDKAELWLCADGWGKRVGLAFEVSATKETTDWAKHEIVLDIPGEAIHLRFGVRLIGAGCVFMDNFALEIVDRATALTSFTGHESGLAEKPINLDFSTAEEAKEQQIGNTPKPIPKPNARPTLAPGWFDGGTIDGLANEGAYELGTSSRCSHSGTKCGFIKSTTKRYRGGATLMQMFRAGSYKGERIKLSGWTKSKDITGWAGMWMRVDAVNSPEHLSFDNMQNRPIKGTNDWTKHEIVLDVPQTSSSIALGVLLYGPGQIWIDDFEIQIVAPDVPLTEFKVSRTETPVNLDFSEDINSAIENHDEWHLYGQPGGAYEIGMDPNQNHLSARSAFIKSRSGYTGEVGSLMQRLVATRYKGKRMRLSGYLKSEKAKSGCGFFFSVATPPNSFDSWDNMNDRVITGTNDWTKCELVLDVPITAEWINFGAYLNGKGQIWISSVKFEAVGLDVLTTGEIPDLAEWPEGPADLDFSS